MPYRQLNPQKEMEKKKLLVVEDDSTLHKALLEFLSAEGFEVVGALDGEEGVEKCREEKPDLVLLDIILPKKDGYEVIAELKADPELAAIPVVLLTNLGSLNDVEKALAMGATTYLVKADYKLEEVCRKVKEILGLE